MHRLLTTAALVTLALAAGLAHAHYPYIVPAKEAGKLNLYFEDAPRAGTGEYLDPFLKGKYWLRSPASDKQVMLKPEDVKKDKQRWFTFTADASTPRAVDAYCKWGVYKGNLLYYYVKHIDAGSAKEIAALAKSSNLEYDLVPAWKDGSLEVQLLWKGKPKAGQVVTVMGPKFREQLKSDENGVITIKPPAKGIYSMRTAFIEPEPAGKEGGEEYKGLRQTGTLTIQLPPGK